MLMPSVRPVHNWRNKINKKNLYPIHLEIKINGKRKYYPISVPLKISSKQWSGMEDQWVKPNHPYFFEINNKIEEKKRVVTDLIKRFYAYNKTLTFPIVLKELNKRYNTGNFNAYMADYIKNPTDKLDPNTFKKYRACLDHLNAFQPEIRFMDLSPELVEDFYQFCVQKVKLEGSTIDSYFNAFKKVVGLARKAQLIAREDAENLFEELHISVKKSNRTYLTIEEIKRWRALSFTSGEEHLARDRDIYLFQLYTGFYYKDVVGLKKEHLVKDHQYGYMILGERDKNDEQNIIPLFRFPYAASIIEKYQDTEPKSKMVFRRNVLLAEPVYNRNLKKLATLAGISKAVSNKVARHSNAQMWIRLGAKKTIVKTMLGHADEKTTDTYFRVGMLEVIDGTSGAKVESLGI
jgi:site-specific recombinase XerD